MAKIVVAEDEKDIRDLLVFILELAGHQVVAVSDGQQAVEAVRREGPDLVILDVRMPRMDGYDACRILKQDPETAHIPVIFLSARGQDSEVQTGLEAGAEKYIVKPFSPEELLSEIAPFVNAKP